MFVWRNTYIYVAKIFKFGGPCFLSKTHKNNMGMLSKYFRRGPECSRVFYDLQPNKTLPHKHSER